VKKLWIYGAFVFIVLLAVVVIAFRINSASKASDARRMGAALVRVQKPSLVLLKDRLSYTGDVLPILQANIYAKVSGNLERNYVEMGTPVHANQLLASIDSTELYQQYQQTNATYENSRLSFERLKQLLDRGLASKQDVDNAEAAMKVSKASFDAAATHLGYARIVAPFNGFITRRFLDAGALVTASSSTLFTMMYLDSVKVIVYVPEKDISQLYKVRTAQVTLDALQGMVFNGRVSRFSESIDLSTRTMPVEVDIANRSRIIKPGTFATINFIVNERPNAITLPSDALLKNDQGYFVFVSDGRTAHQKLVQIGIEQNSQTEILSGINPTDDVITTGQQFVKEGAPINIQK
jgi:membrane fusion protein, multidrug efflux system